MGHSRYFDDVHAKSALPLLERTFQIQHYANPRCRRHNYRNCEFKPHLRATAGQHFNQSIEIILTFVERFHENPFVLSVCPDVVDITREPGVTIRRNAGVSEVASISGTGAHRW